MARKIPIGAIAWLILAVIAVELLLRIPPITARLTRTGSGHPGILALAAGSAALLYVFLWMQSGEVVILGGQVRKADAPLTFWLIVSFWLALGIRCFYTAWTGRVL